MSDSRKDIWYRQRKKSGFDDRETWSLDHTIVEFVLPRLIRFREITPGYPANLTLKKWGKILDQIIYSMQAICDEWEGKEVTLDEKKINKGIYLFGKYFRHLWW